MKHSNLYILTLLLLLIAPAMAQVQKGYVRTIGRPNNPQGTRISGITLRVAGLHSPVVSTANGYFEIDLGGSKTEYMFTSVRDNSYQYELQEKELLNRREAVSTSVPKEIVMISLKEKQSIENKKREQIEAQYQQDIKRLEALKAKDSITIENYEKQLQTLQEQFDKRDMLISTLSEHFASIDYATLTAEQASLCAMLENGDLLTADSIINAKGNIEERIKNYMDFTMENNNMEQALQQRRIHENATKTDLIKDCEAKILIFEQQYKHDSTAYYMELLVKLDTANTHNMIKAGEFFCQYMAQYTKALEYFNKALHTNNEQYGINAITVLCYNNIGYIYEQQGVAANAITCYQKAIETESQFPEKNDTLIAVLYNNMGSCYSDLGKNDQALEYYEKSLEIRKNLYGDNHPLVATIYNNMGYIFYLQNNYAKAIEYYEKALQIRKTAYGETHYTISSGYNNIGAAYYAMSNYDSTLNYFLKAIEINKNIYGENHPQMAIAYGNIGMIYNAIHKYDKAMEYLQQALTIHINTLGEQHPAVATGYSNLGYTCFVQNDYAKAIEYYEKSLKILKATYGEQHPRVANNLRNTGNAYAHMGNYSTTLEYMQQALLIYKSVYGNTHAETIKTYSNIAETYEHMNNYTMALQYYIQAYNSLSPATGNYEKLKNDLTLSINSTYEKVKPNTDKESKQTVKMYKEWQHNAR